ncbi:6194_t:CDS:10 [Paraglomus brasilianum]|uniref:1-(5-phosphoribosyl)-5-[(5-phosphoribosylamino)methylideneamino] imidazole-4-carboxamide isomerase n=1 Tax=Paraglomus brasilianum TaxID=144538 RepID=A0A9N9BQY9_9GLOM|nr:6194_t:CDS:10 [Paraglomus brasilianum]
MRTKFRPCIDLHNGKVKQLVGGSVSENSPKTLRTNFISNEPAGYYAKLYKDNNLRGAHIIKIGPGNDEAAKEALSSWPGGLQIGGGITLDNALEWINLDAKFSLDRLKALSDEVGKDRLIVDISCRKKDAKWFVAMNKWQTITDMEVNKGKQYQVGERGKDIGEIDLAYGADVEGLCQGIDKELVERLAEWTTIPTTYAGGANSIKDLELVNALSNGKVDLTFGSALDIFGGTPVKFTDCVAWNNQE